LEAKPISNSVSESNRRSPAVTRQLVRIGLKPVLKKLGIPGNDVGLHAFRHGLATELVEAAAPLTVLQQQLRHADIKTTLKLYSHAIPESQRAAMEQIGGFESQSLLSSESLLKFVGKCHVSEVLGRGGRQRGADATTRSVSSDGIIVVPPCSMSK
jgi:Phage integrase family